MPFSKIFILFKEVPDEENVLGSKREKMVGRGTFDDLN
tara:strand:+ start:28 stop:141 length:114 start_codon:yes stop_codon:yes gene_type:complete